MSDLAIITGSDAGYFPLVQELIASVEHAAPAARQARTISIRL